MSRSDAQLSRPLDRRSFLVGTTAAGAGFVFGIAMPSAAAPADAGEAAQELTCWVVVAPDNTVTIRTARSEMGQGALTGLAMLIAEEAQAAVRAIATLRE